MSQALIMFPQVTDAEYVHRFKADETLRVTANTLRGTFPAFAISYARSESVALADLPDCPANLPPCDPYELVNYLGSRISVTRPMSFNVFVFVQVAHGFRRRWAEQVQEVEASFAGDSGVFLAAAHLLGRGRFNGVVELLAEDEETCYDVLLRCTDLEGVVLADPHFVAADAQRGMGDPER